MTFAPADALPIANRRYGRLKTCATVLHASALWVAWLAVGKPALSAYAGGVSQTVFRHTHRVTYAECTVGNHVYYGRYLDLLEAARGKFFRQLGHPLAQLQEADTIFPVIEARLRYKAAARYDDVLVIEIVVAEISKVRLTFACRILHESGRLLVEATTVHVCASTADRPKRLPDDLCAALAPYLAPPGSE